jgi:hypothetical protein
VTPRGALGRAAALGLLLLAHLAAIRPTNFAGYDEWLIVDLVERGVLAVPHANRPLGLLPLRPVGILAPHDFLGYFGLGGLYLLLTALATAALVRRLSPGAGNVSFLAGALTIVWGPGDPLRIAAIQGPLYQGITLWMLLAVLLYLESWRRSSRALLLASAAMAFACIRTYEAVLAPFLAAPLLLALLAGRRTPRLWAWLLAWQAVAVAGLAHALLAPADSQAYQRALTADLSPAGVATRLLRLYGHHLASLWSTGPSELLRPAIGVAALLFAALFLLGARGERAWPAAPGERRNCSQLGAAGLVAAALGYFAFALTPSVGTAHRTQFLAGPGIALFLAAAAALVSSLAPPAWRRGTLALLATGIAAVGAARTSAMQDDWDHKSTWAGERRALAGLLEAVPHVAPGTLIVVKDEARVWRSLGNLRFAVSYLYEGRAVGYLHGVEDRNVTTSFSAEGVLSEFSPTVARPWGIRDRRHRYDEIVVARLAAPGAFGVEESWPAYLPPLPPGARYAPGDRIRPAGEIPARRILDLE